MPTFTFFVISVARTVCIAGLAIVTKRIYRNSFQQESPAIADKPARRESLPKIAPIRRAYNVVADSTGLSSCV